jgi:hypothetical protein
VELVDKFSVEKLADGRWSSADANVQAAGGFPGDLQGLAWTGVDEVECRPV